jgi:hypothetical protein
MDDMTPAFAMTTLSTIRRVTTRSVPKHSLPHTKSRLHHPPSPPARSMHAAHRMQRRPCPDKHTRGVQTSPPEGAKRRGWSLMSAASCRLQARWGRWRAQRRWRQGPPAPPGRPYGPALTPAQQTPSTVQNSRDIAGCTGHRAPVPSGLPPARSATAPHPQPSAHGLRLWHETPEPGREVTPRSLRSRPGESMNGFAPDSTKNIDFPPHRLVKCETNG